ncbi:methyltransferase-like protein 22 isoform X2 [Acanthaster planci]|uniref:Methyltransferase-like protein 22 isoform X2 n=1 Tax=Acanthaster planci TaxID=133434 RepID=A0A8B7YS31_ACAPL|nr:methyltransferase-like protein 22 isoform X2 [Acanthaster planci]
MCESGDEVLSDVHIHIPPSSRLSNGGHATTRFYFEIPTSKNQPNASLTLPKVHVCGKQILESKHQGALDNDDDDDDESVTMTTVDEDGDMVVVRKRMGQKERNVIVINHAMATTLSDVGLQVWQGCLLLCDFLLTHREMFKGRVVLELGSGVGLCSTVMAMTASHVFATDIGTSVLELCQRNITHNYHYLMGHSDENQERVEVQVRELDWFQSTKSSDHPGPFQWSKKDIEKLGEVTVIIAADVVYDDDLTDAFFNTLIRLMSSGKDKTAFIALEKRLNFTIEDLNVTCKAYDHFQLHINRLVSSQDVKYCVEQLPVNFPQCFQYCRTEQLELWKMNLVREKNIPVD